MVWAVVFYLWFRDNPLDNPNLNDAERELLRRKRETGVRRTATCPGEVPRARAQVWMLCWQYFCLSYGWYFYITWLPTYLREGRHLEIGSSSLAGHPAAVLGGTRNPAGAVLLKCGSDSDGQRGADAAHHGLHRLRRRQRVPGSLHHG